MQYKITVCYKMEDLLYIYAHIGIQLRIECRCLVVRFLYSRECVKTEVRGSLGIARS